VISDFYTVTISRIVDALSDSPYSKGAIKTPSTVGSFDGRIYTLNANEVIYDESRKPLSTHRGFCDPSVTVLETDRWNDGTNEYQITGINLVQGRSSNHHYEVELLLV